MLSTFLGEVSELMTFSEENRLLVQDPAFQTEESFIPKMLMKIRHH